MINVNPMTGKIADRPILMNGDMVRATLAGDKRNTRRIAKLDTDGECRMRDGECFDAPESIVWKGAEFAYCPYGKVGDVLWVRENWSTCRQVDGVKPSELSKGEPIFYPANEKWRSYGCAPIGKGKGRPNIFMMRWMSRLTLEITDIRIEKLQDISEKDAKAEGVTVPEVIKMQYPDNAFRYEFENLWQSINGKKSWDKNPWVWVIEFKTHHMNVDSYLAQEGEVT